MLIALFAFFQGESGQPAVQQFGRTRAIQLDVQNGSGEPKLAQKLTDFLRAEGFDVVELGNYKSGSVLQTLVIDRIGNPEAAKSVAKALGISEEKVVQQIDKNLFLDATVVIGKDFTKLKAFK
ncbi:MAG: LytR C-terminal domain-containing protein [Bacteroidota bacterium]